MTPRPHQTVGGHPVLRARQGSRAAHRRQRPTHAPSSGRSGRQQANDGGRNEHRTTPPKAALLPTSVAGGTSEVSSSSFPQAHRSQRRLEPALTYARWANRPSRREVKRGRTQGDRSPRRTAAHERVSTRDLRRSSVDLREAQQLSRRVPARADARACCDPTLVRCGLQRGSSGVGSASVLDAHLPSPIFLGDPHVERHHQKR